MTCSKMECWWKIHSAIAASIKHACGCIGGSFEMSIIDGNSMSWPLLHVVSCLMYLNAAASMQLPQCSCPIEAASMQLSH